MMNHRLDETAHRLLRAEQEIMEARADIRALQVQCRRLRRVRTIAGGLSLAAAIVAIGVLVPSRPQAAGPLTVTAPFVVVDSKGKPLMMVNDVRSDASRGLYMFDGNGMPVAHMGTGDGGGRVYVTMPGQKPAALLATAAAGPLLELVRPNRSTFFKVEKGEKEGLWLYNEAELPVIELTLAHLKIADEQGNTVVEAGVTPDGRGLVRAGPRKGGPPAPGTLGFPYQIVGRK